MHQVLRFILFLALITAPLPVNAQVLADQEYTFAFKGSLISAIRHYEGKYPVKFYFDENRMQNDSVSVAFAGKSLDEAVRYLLSGKPYTYRILSGKHIVILPSDKVARLTNIITDYTTAGTAARNFVQIGSDDQGIRRKSSRVSGKIIDAKTGEPVIGAMVQVSNTTYGAVTNLQGEYNLLLDAGFYTLIVSSSGYEKNEYHVKVVNNGTLNMELYDRLIEFEDVVILGERLDKNVSSYQMSLIELDAKSIRQLPSVSGATDVIKALTTMPGVKSIGEFSSGINVRGGGEDQNLYLYNGAPIFNTSHVFGLLSVINPDVVNRLTLYKGHIPSMYGERLSSVVDIRSSDSYPERLSFNGGIGIYDSRLFVKVPVVKNHMFFDAGWRTSYSDWIMKNANDPYLNSSNASFHDLNGTLHLQFSKSRISLSGYSSYDEFNLSQDVKYNYGSKLGSVNWSIMHRSDLASYFTYSSSSYNVDKELMDKPTKAATINSGIRHKALRYRIKYSGFRKQVLDAGFNIINYRVNPGELTPRQRISENRYLKLPGESAFEGAFFINDEVVINPKVTLNLGLRLSAYKHENSGTFFGFEPRLSSRFQIDNVSSVKVSFNRNVQYISLISPTAVATPSDIWKLSNDNILPGTAYQLAAGYYRNFSNNTIETSVEIYYKLLNHMIEYEDGVVLSMNPDLEQHLYDALGTNYGIEFTLKKSAGSWDGWIGYTYSRSFREVDDPSADPAVFNGQYPSSYDKPHDFSAVTTFHLNRRVRFSGNFSYSTGRPVTLPEQKARIGDMQLVVFSNKNQYRIPDYHRLDLSVTFGESLRLRRRWKGSLTLSVLNVYGRKNPYTVYYSKEKASVVNDYNAYGMYMLYLIGKPLPTVSYTFRF